MIVTWSEGILQMLRMIAAILVISFAGPLSAKEGAIEAAVDCLEVVPVDDVGAGYLSCVSAYSEHCLEVYEPGDQHSYAQCFAALTEEVMRRSAPVFAAFEQDPWNIDVRFPAMTLQKELDLAKIKCVYSAETTRRQSRSDASVKSEIETCMTYFSSLIYLAIVVHGKVDLHYDDIGDVDGMAGAEWPSNFWPRPHFKP